MITREFWEERYSSSPAIWSGNPNVRLVEVAGELSPGDALDVGSGEGADAIWLADRGWQVTGLDISSVALDRAAGHAAQAGSDVAARTSWQQGDLLEWEPGVEVYDLVSAQYIHLPREILQQVHRRLAAAVRRGGLLLIVGHHPSDMETSMGRPKVQEMFFTADDLATELDPADWEVVTSQAPGRQAPDPDGRIITIRDAVLAARRR